MMTRFFVMSRFEKPQCGMKLRYVDEHEKNTELVRNKTNSSSVSSFEFVMFVADFIHTRTQSSGIPVKTYEKVDASPHNPRYITIPY